MVGLRYHIRTDWLFYLFLVGYGYLVADLTLGLWSGGDVNIFTAYSSATTPADMVADANKIYWSKTCFLFGTLALIGLNVDVRTAVGAGALFWSVSLLWMFGPSPNLMIAAVFGTLLIALQIKRKEFFGRRHSN